MKVPRAVQNTKFLLNQRHDHAAEKNGVATSSLDDRSAQERNRPANQLRWIGVVILLAAFAVRAYNLGGTSLWFDEAVAVINSNHPFGEMIQQARDATSPMPVGLLNSLNAQEVADLLAYLVSGANAKDALYTK